SPLSRAGGHGLKKSALLIIAHYQLTELLPFLEKFQFERENLQELKTWVIQQLGFREMSN
ncbi:MAG: hypothetical protein KDD34_09025, partial [Bdellovibrionales bacterium]|nr:hypothetical protein [Bdellovibrionales bacterium]